MRRELIVDRSLGMTRAALLEDGALCELHIEPDGGGKRTGGLYLGRVETIKPSVCAAFVDIGLEKNAFLPLGSEEPPRCGEMILVQAKAVQATETKGLRVTRRVSLPGALLALFPDGEGVRVSRKLTDPALRARLSALGEAIRPEGFGLTLRTASADADEAALRAELAALLARWDAARKKGAGMRAPGALEQRAPLELSLLRELSAAPLARIVTNDEASFSRLLAEREAGRLPAETAVEFYDEAARGTLLFDAFALEGKIEKALARRVDLPGGGYLVIDRCEALTAIDVNSGRFSRALGAEDAAFAVDLEAAEELMRQLRLRNIGGIVVVDFIDLSSTERREALISRLRDVARADRAPVTVEGMTRLGLAELTRKRGGEELVRALCGPEHRVRAEEALSPEERARSALRDVRRKALSGQRGPFLVRCPAPCAEAMARIGNPVDARVYVFTAPGKAAVRQLAQGEALPDGAQAI